MHYTTVAPSSRGLEMDQSQSTTLSGEEYGRETQWSVTIPWTDQVDIQFVYSLAPQELLYRFGLKYAYEEQLCVSLNLDLFHKATLGAKIEVRSYDLEQFEAEFKQVTSHSVLSHWSGLTLKHKKGPMSFEYETKFTFFPFESKLDLHTHLLTSFDAIPEVDVTLTRKKTIIT